MCEANVYMTSRDGENETLIMEAVDKILPEGPDSWRLTSIFGEQKIVSGHIKSMKLVEHRIIFADGPSES
ncbi:RNA-binding protein [Deltaproteobacteria bacterium Smac51]|nr:RNA-binding protein [Deltaproteobacteria bacterium Smac51]